MVVTLKADYVATLSAGEIPLELYRQTYHLHIRTATDDFHLLTDQCISEFLCMLANRLPANVHLIVASRDRFLPAAEVVRLGARRSTQF